MQSLYQRRFKAINNYSAVQLFIYISIQSKSYSWTVFHGTLLQKKHVDIKNTYIPIPKYKAYTKARKSW